MPDEVIMDFDAKEANKKSQTSAKFIADRTQAVYRAINNTCEGGKFFADVVLPTANSAADKIKDYFKSKGFECTEIEPRILRISWE